MPKLRDTRYVSISSRRLIVHGIPGFFSLAKTHCSTSRYELLTVRYLALPRRRDGQGALAAGAAA
jgi:hypothetical protein